MVSAPESTDSDPDSYAVRPYQPDDVEAFLSLREAVWGRAPDRDWFDWKYVDNPSAEGVRMFVAETADGELVGARPFVPFRMSAAGTPALGLMATDMMVHPDHRRRGVFTRMNERALDHHTRGEAAFVFNRPNERAAAGYRKLDWRMIRPMRKYFRIQDPGGLARSRFTGPRGRLFAGVAALGGRGYLSLRGAFAPVREEYTVRRHDGVEAPVLASLYERDVPEALHAIRDEAFYRWRFANPTRTRATYVAERNGEPVAGVVARTGRDHNDDLVTQIADVAPLVGGSEWRAAVASLVDRVVSDHDASTSLVTTAALPDEALRPHGFLPDDVPPLSWLKEKPYDLAVRSLSPAGDWTVGGLSLLSPENWRLTHAEREN